MNKETQKKPVLYWILLIFLAAAGFFINGLKITLFYNVDIIFGSVFVVLVIMFYGPVWGTLAGAIAASYTYILWNHPYAIIIFTLEAVLIGFIHERKKMNLMFLDVLYWLFLGMPLVFLFYHIVMGMDSTGASLIMLKQAVNGILNVFIASILYMPLAAAGRKPSFLPQREGLKFTDLLFNTILGFVLIPSLFFTMYTGRVKSNSMEEEIIKGARGNAEFTSFIIDSRVSELDTRGDYLQKESSAKLKQLIEEYVESHNDLSALFIVTQEDGENSVEFAAGKKDLPIASILEDLNELSPLEEDENIRIFRWLPPAMRNISVMERWKEAVYLAESKDALIPQWKIFTIYSIAPYQEEIYADSLNRLFIIAAALFLSAFFSRVLASRYVKPLGKLREITTNLPQKIEKPSLGGLYLPDWPKTYLVEISSLISNFRSMTNSLRRMFLHLQDTNRNLLIEKERAEEASRVKSRFLANMSHDIRTPTIAIKGLSDIIREETDLSQAQEDYVVSISESAAALLELLNNILDLSKIEAGKLSIEETDFEIQGLVKRMDFLFGTSARMKGLAFECTVDDSVPEFLKGDPLRIQQVLMNLLGNALKFTSRGKVSLTVKREMKLEVPEGSGAGGEGPKDRGPLHPITFIVEDTGIGIPEESRELVFESFSQSDPSVVLKYGGSGLGLTISRELVSLMGGRISFESTSGEGSSFFFTLPMEEGNPEHSKKEREMTLNEEEREDLSEVNKGGYRVLLAEDNVINSKVAERILSKAGFSVETAFNGEEVLSCLREKDIDIVLMDINMPLLDGVETTRRIRSGGDGEGKVKNPNVPIIALTAGLVDEDNEEWMEAGMNDVLQKPLNLKEFKEKVARYAGR